MSKKRRNHTPEFKAQVVLELLREEMTVNELAAKHQISPVLISRWKSELMERAAEVFRKGPSEAEKELVVKEEHIADLERKVGQLTVEVDWLKKIYRTARPKENAWQPLSITIPISRLNGNVNYLALTVAAPITSL